MLKVILKPPAHVFVWHFALKICYFHAWTTMNKNSLISHEITILSSDFHGFSKSTSTCDNSSSDFRTSLGMLGYVFISPIERSRDLEGYYTGRVAACGRIKSSKVGCFAFRAILAIRRCVRPYLYMIHGTRLGWVGWQFSYKSGNFFDAVGSGVTFFPTKCSLNGL